MIRIDRMGKLEHGVALFWTGYTLCYLGGLRIIIPCWPVMRIAKADEVLRVAFFAYIRPHANVMLSSIVAAHVNNPY